MDAIIRRPDDFHLHLRGGDMLKKVAHHSAKRFARGLIMPNVPAVCNAEDMIKYKNEILSLNLGDFQPLMTIKIDAKTTPEQLVEAHKAGAIAAKLYPAGVTTGSADGVDDFNMDAIFETMQSMDMVLCIHGEMPGVFCLDREYEFLYILGSIVGNFPNLRIVLEHITTKEAVEYVSKSRNVFATITAHHLVDTLDAVVGDLLSPHRFCKPIPKFPADRSELRKAACSGSSKFFFGSDSAPHLKEAKECASGCAGCFTAPVALATLAEVFHEEKSLSQLEKFTSQFGAEFYRLRLNSGELVLKKDSWTVPQEYDGIVPWRAGETLPWQVVGKIPA